MDLRTGDILLFYTPLSWNPLSWLSALIRWRTGCPYNHVAIVVEWNGIPMVCEANEKGHVTSAWDGRLYKREKDVMVLVPHQVQEDCAKRAVMRLGKSRYGFKDLLYYHLLQTLGWDWRGKKGEQAKDDMVCSEFAAYCHSDVFLGWYKASPMTIYQRSGFNHIPLSEIKKGKRPQTVTSRKK